MGFRFSLAAVLLVRREREAAEERLLGAAERELAAARAQRDVVRGELRRLGELRAGEGSQVRQGVALHEQYARLAVLGAACAEMDGQVAELGTRRDVRRRAYVAARRDCELLEEMEASQRASFVAGAGAREQKRSDDLFLARQASARGMRR